MRTSARQYHYSVYPMHQPWPVEKDALLIGKTPLEVIEHMLSTKNKHFAAIYSARQKWELIKYARNPSMTPAIHSNPIFKGRLPVGVKYADLVAMVDDEHFDAPLRHAMKEEDAEQQRHNEEFVPKQYEVTAICDSLIAMADIYEYRLCPFNRDAVVWYVWCFMHGVPAGLTLDELLDGMNLTKPIKQIMRSYLQRATHKSRSLTQSPKLQAMFNPDQLQEIEHQVVLHLLRQPYKLGDRLYKYSGVAEKVDKLLNRETRTGEEKYTQEEWREAHRYEVTQDMINAANRYVADQASQARTKHKLAMREKAAQAALRRKHEGENRA